MLLEAVDDRAVGALLDPPETTVPQPDNDPTGGDPSDDDLELAFRHRGWLVDRARVRRALEAAQIASARIDRFDRCGSRAWVQRASHDPSIVRVRADYCHDRFCAPCAAARGRNISGRLRAWLAGRPARFVTLTIAADGRTLSERLDRLFASFRRMRRGRWWRSRCDGGAAILEIKWAVTSAHWHPHLHILCRGRFLDQTELSKEWHVATGDSFIVNVQLIKAGDQVADYLTKYMIKPGCPTIYRDPDRLQEMIRTLHGRRLLTTFGDCKIPDEPADPTDDTTWITIGRLSSILSAAARGVPDAKVLCLLLGVNPAWKPAQNIPDTS